MNFFVLITFLTTTKAYSNGSKISLNGQLSQSALERLIKIKDGKKTPKYGVVILLWPSAKGQNFAMWGDSKLNFV